MNSNQEEEEKAVACPKVVPGVKEDDDDDSKKRKRAVLFGYSGSGFKGLQSQHGGIVEESNENEDTTPDTVEDALHLALYKAGAMRESNAHSFQKIGWTRSARTDRGVHAASQVIGAKLQIPHCVELKETGEVSRQDEADFVAKVNSFLPSQIRVYRIMRVMNNFNARSATCFRTYGYFLPRFVLVNENSPRRLSFDQLVSELSDVLQAFVGTKSFHNYTEKHSPRDPRSMRIIHSFTAEPSGQDMIRLKVKGQSFLKHHIRRMVGFAVECVRNSLGAETVLQSLNPSLVCVPNSAMPTAPAEALFLDVASFEAYNESIKKKTVNSVDREPIDFENDESVKTQREDLIQHIVFPAIFSEESGAHQAFESWLKSREGVEFPPWFDDSAVASELADAEEFLRVVERDRVKRLKIDEYKRSAF